MRAMIVLATLALAACVEQKPVDGAALFAENCASCHGADAKGDAEMAAALGKSIPDLTQIAARNGGVFDHDAVMSTIDGLHRSEDNPMPEFGDGDMGEIIMVGSTPIPAELFALANYLHSIQE